MKHRKVVLASAALCLVVGLVPAPAMADPPAAAAAPSTSDPAAEVDP